MGSFAQEDNDVIDNISSAEEGEIFDGLSPKYDNLKELHLRKDELLCGLSRVTTYQQETLTEDFGEDEVEILHSSDEVVKYRKYQCNGFKINTQFHERGYNYYSKKNDF